MNFDEAFSFIMKFEGGYVNDQRDPGGETKFGISKNVYKNLDIASLTIDQAKQIYRVDYWDALHLDAFPPIVRLAMFDSAVNCGVPSTIRFLQMAVGTKADGFIGPETLNKLESAVALNGRQVLTDILWWRYKKVSGASNFNVYGDGWTRRMMSVIANSAA